jgi:hypothetical protein
MALDHPEVDSKTLAAVAVLAVGGLVTIPESDRPVWRRLQITASIGIHTAGL